MITTLPNVPVTMNLEIVGNLEEGRQIFRPGAILTFKVIEYGEEYPLGNVTAHVKLTLQHPDPDDWYAAEVARMEGLAPA